MFDFAVVTENGILRWNIRLLSLLSVGDQLLPKRYIESIILTSKDRKYEWSNLYF